MKKHAKAPIILLMRGPIKIDEWLWVGYLNKPAVEILKNNPDTWIPTCYQSIYAKVWYEHGKFHAEMMNMGEDLGTVSAETPESLQQKIEGTFETKFPIADLSI